jgi:TonB-linked SusC/RagA family outer membrane protein
MMFHTSKFFIMKEKLLQLAKVPKRPSFYSFLVLCLFLIVTLNTEVVAQQITVKGTISTEAGEPVPGVSILIKGTTTGTITGMNGEFEQDVSGPDAVLQISSVGYKTQEITVGNQTQIDVALVEDVTALGEIVVVGYGTQKRSDLTGAVTSIPSKEITELPLARADQAIQGRTSGVYVLNSDASPGGETIIRIRGLNSINGGNEPLVVLDGLQGGEELIRSLNPMDVESIEILKDASATAIYGSRGANGVILITTKQGKTGKPVIDFSLSYGVQNLARKLPVMDAVTYAEYMNLVRSKDTGAGNIPEPIFDADDIARFERDGGTDWQDVVYETGLIQNYQIGVSGATDKLKYMVSANYLDHKGILKGSGYDRMSLRTNLSADIAEWVDFGLNWAFTRETYKSPVFRRGEGISFTAQTINVAPRWAPTEPVYDADGNYQRHGYQPDGTVETYGPNDTWNPLASAIEPEMDRPTYRNNVNLFLNFNIVKGLSLKLMGGAIIRNAENRDYYNTKTHEGFANNGSATLRNSTYERYQNSNILTYTNTFGKHQLTVTGVLEQIYDEGHGTETIARNFIVDQLGFNNIGGAQQISKGSWAYDRSLLSYLGRVNYVYGNKYLLTLTYRADGSSVFGKDNKWGYFPSGSIAWRISEENFLSGSDLITELKIRASWGETGNQGISPYQTLARLYSEPGDWGPDYPYNGISPTNTGFAIGGLANPNLKWETTAQTNLGLDLSMFNGRLTSTIDVYKKVTEDLLMPRELPGYVGVSSVVDNIGSIENKGLEILIGGDPIVGNLRWNTSFNLTANRNKVLDLGTDERLSYSASFGGYSLGEFMILEVGEPFGTMRGWQFLGIWGTDEEEEARSYGQLPGDYHLLDNDGDGDVDEEDRVYIGNGYPDFTWGWSNRFTWKNFDLSFLFIGMQGADLFNQLRIRRESYEANDPRVLNYWTPDNQDTDVPGLIDGAYREAQALESKMFVAGNGRGGEMSKWVEDASFIKLKVITLAYNFNRTILDKIGFNQIRVYFTGTNLWTITDYTGYDPEVANFTESDATIGVDLSAYPPARTYTFGLEMTF